MEKSDLEKIQEVFPGAEPVVPTELTSRICILNDVRVHEVFEQVAYVYGVDPEGIQTDVDNPIDSWPELEKDYRTYFCGNCKMSFAGEETFDDCRNHLGKKNYIIHPFSVDVL